MASYSATDIARNFSAMVNRVGAGEEIEIVRNGVAVAELRPAGRRHAVSASRWRELMSSAPRVDDDFARDVEEARARIGPPSGAWPS